MEEFEYLGTKAIKELFKWIYWESCFIYRMGKIVKVRNGKGKVFEIDEDLLNGEPCQLSDS